MTAAAHTLQVQLAWQQEEQRQQVARGVFSTPKPLPVDFGTFQSNMNNAVAQPPLASIASILGKHALAYDTLGESAWKRFKRA
jgi:hypothetical protein